MSGFCGYRVVIRAVLWGSTGFQGSAVGAPGAGGFIWHDWRPFPEGYWKTDEIMCAQCLA